MEDIRFYDEKGTLLHILSRYTSVNWRLFLNEVGTFELHFPLESELTQLVTNVPFLLIVQGEKQAILTGVQLAGEGVLYGKTPNFLLTKFLDELPFSTETIESHDAQSVCRTIFLRRFPKGNFVFSDTEGDFPEVSYEKEECMTLFEVVRSVMHQAGGGHGVRYHFAKNAWECFVTMGKKLPVVISERNKNAEQTTVTKELLLGASGGVYKQKMQHMGVWDASENSPALVQNNPENYAKYYTVGVAGSQFGLRFRAGDVIFCRYTSGMLERGASAEDFYVRLPGEEAGILAFDAPLSATDAIAAQKELLKQAQHEKEETNLKTRDFLWGRDYNLGDTAHVEFKKGPYQTRKVKKITGVHIFCEAGERGEAPIFSEVEHEL